MNLLLRSILLCLVPSMLAASVSAEELKLRDICRIKGQEITTVQGLGLVVGLKGTGDPDAKPTAKALARMIQLMGGQISTDPRGQLMLDDVEQAGNVALVFVTARVPEVGAQQGDRLDCTVNAIGAKSLAGGTLMLSPLLGPRADQPTVYAMAEGPLRISNPDSPTSAMVHQGAKMERSLLAPFHENGKLTLILDRDFADFDTVQWIEDAINSQGEQPLTGESAGIDPSARVPVARAIDQLHIEVDIPPVYRNNPISFISLLLGLRVALPNNDTRVVINEREGVVVIGEEVRIAPVLITHRNLRIEAGARPGFVPVDAAAPKAENAKLKNLADALNALEVPTDDLIAIIKALKTKGDLYGDVIFQ
ncbi:Flagellar P-ring protein precursor [Rosistilla oblonga]|uniref:Flagellar P-ring protein n=1 Tax=Rosistilla oblonga TaxID=2527990 RepID=A0A518IQG6_9BACT|nr:flagellar basal body P-ring protein FlgI [Rosistilla oblonga]QDV11378.1 Flagellar P-ring protein precursor [Rosistilla oblonga]QDV55324.1 Flagellar P-ring protein precursor [Rosistilla oblonga]